MLKSRRAGQQTETSQPQATGSVTLTPDLQSQSPFVSCAWMPVGFSVESLKSLPHEHISNAALPECPVVVTYPAV